MVLIRFVRGFRDLEEFSKLDPAGFLKIAKAERGVHAVDGNLPDVRGVAMRSSADSVLFEHRTGGASGKLRLPGRAASLWRMFATFDSIRSASGDRVAQLRFECIAGKIEREPGLLEIPLANIARWLAQGHSARERLEGWRDMIELACDSSEGLARLVALLREDSADVGEWKAFSPFAGVLTREELDGLRWTSRH